MTGLGPAAKSLGGGVALAATAPVLHLDEAVKSALAHQPTVREARAQTEMAAGRVEQARSGYLPQITGQARYQRAHGTTTVSTGTGAAAGPATAVGTRGVTYDLFSAGVSATQLIWDFGQTIDKTRAASASREAQESAERTARFLVVLQVRQTFFQAHAERALVRVGEDAVANQERHLAQIQGFVDQGIRPEIDLAQAKTDLA
ncbi:MAG TPA: TolC family protein, partial [Polyangiaceae bacterium]